MFYTPERVREFVVKNIYTLFYVKSVKRLRMLHEKELKK